MVANDGVCLHSRLKLLYCRMRLMRMSSEKFDVPPYRNSEAKVAARILEEPEEIAAYQDTASTLRRSALGADETVALIEQMLKEMT
ncbi:MAG: Scr1 family TA system antitoxin-like transcriptional regulator [Candidatus Binatia bacterium]